MTFPIKTPLDYITQGDSVSAATEAETTQSIEDNIDKLFSAVYARFVSVADIPALKAINVSELVGGEGALVTGVTPVNGYKWDGSVDYTGSVDDATVVSPDSDPTGASGAWVILVFDNNFTPVSDVSASTVTTDTGTQTVQGALDDRAGRKTLTKDVSGPNGVNLLTSEVSANNVIILDGEITADKNVAFPQNAPGIWKITNSTTGDFVINVIISGGSGFRITRGVSGVVRSDGSAVYFDSFRDQIGRTTGGGLVARNPNIIAGHPDNYITTDVHSSVIAGGGGNNSENVIGGLSANVGNSGVSNVDPNGVVGTEARYSSIGGGYDNVNNAIASHITGAHCKIETDADHGTISGGSYHSITDGSYNTISGGTQCTIDATSGYCVIAGGGTNLISAASQYSTISGGSSCSLEGIFATIGGGNSNDIATGGDNSTIGGGGGNTIDAANATIAGGNGNSITGSGGTIAGGMFNVAAGTNSLVPGGRENSADGNNSTAYGFQAKADLAGQVAYAAGQFTTKGDAQFSNIVLKKTTTDGTEAILLNQAGGTDLSVKSSIAIGYRVQIVGHRTDVQGDNALYILEGIAHRASSGTFTVNGFADRAVGPSSGSWSARVYDNGFGSLRVAVTGEAAKTIQWVAKIEFIENIG